LFVLKYGFPVLDFAPSPTQYPMNSIKKMKVHTTNYKDTFIEIADDSPASSGEIPPLKGDKKSVANLQYELISKNPYKFTSDDVLFKVYAERNDLSESELAQAREQFFSKGQPCLRASPLTKRYGWGIHNDENGKIALFGSDSETYKKFCKDKSVTTVKAMKSSR
jgi:hypothetical protein